MGFFPKGWGEYPPEYNRAVHGPYDPSVYYGKRDTPFTEVKLGELTSWLGRRNKTPRAMAQAISRAWWRYQFTWVQPKHPGAAFLYQLIAGIAITSYMVEYTKLKRERRYKYH